MPFGFDAECWRQMGYGIDWMNAVALWVAGLPGAFGRVNSFGTGPLLLATAGLLADRASQDAAALERRRARGARDHLGGPRAGAGHSGCRRRPLLRGARCGRPARLAPRRRRRVCHSRMARRRHATGATPAIPRSATASAAIRPAASASSPTAGWSPTRWRRTRSRRIAGAQQSSWRRAMRRRLPRP